MKEEKSVGVPKTAQNSVLLTIIIFGIIREKTCMFFSFLTSGTIGRQVHIKKYEEEK